ncbi:MAG: hypothetical protein IT386_16005 [Deltaproteobacteria bacterium]|nr:hypothetical protein [Deltaproteobacteria bacterium]
MRVVFAAAIVLVAAACASGGGPPPSASEADAQTNQSQAPCLGTTDGDCPSGNPMQDF